MKATRLFAALLGAAMVLALLPTAALASDEANLIFDVSEGNIAISGAGGGNLSVTYGSPQTTTAAFAGTRTITITGTTIANTVTVSAGTAQRPVKIKLSGVNIDVSGTLSTCAFDMEGSTVSLALEGDNTLISGSERAGLHCPEGAALTISDGPGAGTGRLTATGGVFSAGIGGGGTMGNSEMGGGITIESGAVSATGRNGGAGIGGGDNGAGGNIEIRGGTVAAGGGDYSAGIGGGASGSGGNITIRGGTVTAGCGYGGAGIGGGASGSGGNMTIRGGTVTATGIDGAGIGGGIGGDGGTVIISGGSIMATSGIGADTIGHGKFAANSGTVKNKPAAEGGVDVFLTTVTLSGAVDKTAVSGLTTDAGYAYGTDGMKTDGSVLYLYLPENTRTTGAKTGAPTPTAAYLGSVTTAADSSGAGTLDPAVFDVTGDPAGYAYDYRTTHTLTFTQSGSYTVSMLIPGATTAAERIVVSAGTASNPVNLALNGVNIDLSTAVGCAFDMSGATVNLTLDGGNILMSGGNHAGLRCPGGAALTIEGTGSLAAMGSGGGSGIGGSRLDGAGTIVIRGGTVFAEGLGGSTDDIGCGELGSGGSLSISGAAAVLLKNDNCIAPATTTHTHENITGHAAGDPVYGIPAPWAGGFGAYLRLYTLSYDRNGGGGAVPSPLTQQTGTTATVAGGSGLSRDHYAFAGWNTQPGGSGTAYAAGSAFAFPEPTTLYAQWRAVITGVPQTFTMYEGGRVTWDPQPEGGTWDWDHSFFSATFNSPATFTALRTGTSTIAYTVGGVSQSVTVTIKASELPQTGQNDTPLRVLIALAILCGGLAVALPMLEKKRKAR